MASVYGLCRVSDPTIRYVGFTSRSVEERFRGHAYSARQGENLPVYRWWRKYGDVIFVVLHDNLTIDEAFELEKQEIASRDNLLNLTGGGEGHFGYSPSDETRARISQSLIGNQRTKGRKLSAEHRQKISEGMKGNRNSVGVVPSDSARANMRKAQLGRKHKPETIEKIIAGNKGKIVSAETRARISATRQNLSAEARANMSAARLNIPRVSCPHCAVTMDVANAARYHFDKCKTLALVA